MLRLLLFTCLSLNCPTKQTTLPLHLILLVWTSNTMDLRLSLKDQWCLKSAELQPWKQTLHKQSSSDILWPCWWQERGSFTRLSHPVRAWMWLLQTAHPIPKQEQELDNQISLSRRSLYSTQYAYHSVESQWILFLPYIMRTYCPASVCSRHVVFHILPLLEVWPSCWWKDKQWNCHLGPRRCVLLSGSVPK
jgi:hypothetical protein